MRDRVPVLPSRSPALALCAVWVATLLTVASPADAASLITGLGGPAGFGPTGQCLPRNDDGYSNLLDVRSVFPSGLNFFGRAYNAMYVNTNGSISFGSGISQFTPNAFPGAPQPMIAPYWADIDTRRSFADGSSGGGAVGSCPNDTDDAIWWVFDAANHRIIVTWFNVGYYDIHMDHRMSFQLVLSQPALCGGAGGVGNFDVEFRFNRCEWETGDASGGTNGFGGTPAQSGFDSGMATYMGGPAWVSLPRSRMVGVAAALCQGPNVAPVDPGVWRFSVLGGTVTCPGAGAACMVPGQQGVCAQGLTNCVGSGLACVQVNQPGAERCNGLDDDCDGAVDQGDGLCGVAERCVQGVCVASCVEGSCFTGYVCDGATGLCVDELCRSVSCPAGQVCRLGVCQGPCDGITCPIGQVCRAGRCADPCAGVTCTGSDVCENGVCVPPCGPCRTCGTGRACGSDGRCVNAACASVSCAEGEACRDGACVDACDGAVCPVGQRCEHGQCIDAPPSVPGEDAGVDPDAESPSVPGDAGSSSDASGSTEAGTRLVRRTATGCTCHAAGRRGSPTPDSRDLATLLLAAGALAGVRRRRPIGSKQNRV